MGQVDDTGCQRLLDGGQSGHLAIATLVQRRTGGIQHNGGLVLVNRELDLAGRAALLKPGFAVHLPQPLDRRFFDDGLAVRYTVQLRVERPALDREGIHAPDKVLEGQFGCAVKQLGESPGRETAQNDEHTLGRAQIDVCPDHHRKIPFKGDLSVGGLNILAAHPLDLAGEDALQTKQTGAADRKCSHIVPPFTH